MQQPLSHAPLLLALAICPYFRRFNDFIGSGCVKQLLLPVCPLDTRFALKVTMLTATNARRRDGIFGVLTLAAPWRGTAQ